MNAKVFKGVIFVLDGHQYRGVIQVPKHVRIFGVKHPVLLFWKSRAGEEHLPVLRYYKSRYFNS
jgi:hypothetical protein